MNTRASLEKIVVNAGIGRLSQHGEFEKKALPQISDALKLITGQAPEARRARQSIAGFKVREGQIIGLRATVRRQRMVDFLERLITIVLPRVRDFRGIKSASVDGRGNLTVGIRDYTVFPEINPETAVVQFGLQITIVPRRPVRAAEAAEFYRALGVPMQKT
ncbi:MAG: 50S ribosomal protein L5 [Candidatus Liptonbacteria bacterium]|nr:50S ribosomal protein L5 [Candidatus Liptonbacteria bacterium]